MIALSSLLFVMIGCSKSQDQAPRSQDYSGSREFKVDENVGRIQVTVYGSVMGTPDAGKLDYLLHALNDGGHLAGFVQSAPGIEGGSTYCFGFASDNDKKSIPELLKSIATDPKETNYTVKSVMTCS